MKNFLSLLATAFLLSGVLFLTSCGDDDPTPGTGNDVFPTVAISGVSSTVVDPGTVVSFTVTGDKGTNDLNSFTVTEDGVNLSTDRYSITEYTTNGITLNNPQLLIGNDASNFVYTVNITTVSENADPTLSADYVYEVVLADNKGNTDSDFVTVTVNSSVDPGTPTTFEDSGILLNQAGPAGTGGLDLDTGNGTGSGNSAAEIRDLGIDCTVGSGENWRAQFGTVNGADMVKVDLNIVEGFTFASATTTEAIQGAYDTGISLSSGISTAPNCDETTVTDVATPSVGDMYVVFANGTYYLIRVDEINQVSGSNADNYVFSIKY